MRYSDHEQRQLDIASGAALDQRERAASEARAPYPHCSHRLGCTAARCVWRKDGKCIAKPLDGRVAQNKQSTAAAEVRVQSPSRPPK